MVRAPGEPHDDVLLGLYAAERAALPAGAEIFDAHTHIGHDDPDGFEADPEEILAGLDRAGQQRALVFPMHEPGGYGPANDSVLAAVAAAGGRLLALGRIDPNAPGAVAEARRCLEAGAVGIKLHPRSDGFGLPHPVVEDVVALVAARRGVVLFHAGRGIPRLGPTVVALARRHPDVRIVLAHAGISDVGWIGPDAAALPNLLFDTAWWQVADLLTLYATIPPARILYASDMPYGSGVLSGFAFLRCARAVGLGADALVSIAGGQLARVVAGDDLAELGPPPGTAALGPRDLGFERAAAYLGIAAQLCWRDVDPSEPLALARLALHRLDDHPLVPVVDDLARAGLEAVSEGRPEGALPAAVAGQVLAGTPASALLQA